MRFKEFIRGKNKIDNLRELGAIGFGKSLTGAHDELTPHYEIRRTLLMYEQNPIVNSGINQLILFLIPNKKVKISSECPRTVEFLETWHEQRPGIIEEYKNILLLNKVCGNGYLEKKFRNLESGKNVLDNIFCINDAGRIWVNPDNDEYLYELPIGIKDIIYMGEKRVPKFTRVQYIVNYVFAMQNIYGITIPGWKIGHYKTGLSRDGIYGRSGLASAIDIDNIMRNIINSWNAISLGRNLDKKLISVSDLPTDMQVDQKRLDEIGKKLEDSDNQFTLFNIPLKLIQTDITSTGRYDLMEGVFDVLRRMIMVSLLPQHLTPWGESATTQGTSQAMPSFLLRLKSEQNSYIQFLNKEVIGTLRKTYTWLADDASFVFDEPLVRSNEEYVDSIGKLVDVGMLTPTEAKLYMTKMGIIDAEVVEETEKEKKKLVDVISEGNRKASFIAEEHMTPSPSFKKFKKKTGISGYEYRFKSIGGKEVRLIKDKTSFHLYEGIKLINSFDCNFVFIASVNIIFDDYCLGLEKLQDTFITEDKLDGVVDKYNDEVRELIVNKINSFLDKVSKSEVKKEGFLSDTIFSKLDKLLRGVNDKIRTISFDAVDTIYDSVGIKIDANEDTKKLLSIKKGIVKKQVADQVINTKDNLLQDIKRDISNGIAAGKDFKLIRDELKQKYKKDDSVEYKMNRVMRTELNRATNIFKLKSWLEKGFENFEWHTREDERVREAHRVKNRRVYSIKEALNSLDNDAFPGKAINCRCVATIYD